MSMYCEHRNAILCIPSAQRFNQPVTRCQLDANSNVFGVNSRTPLLAVWEGLNVVRTGRQMLGATNPADSLPGTIRGDLCIQVGRNIIHGSDAVDSAKKEIALWFTEKELVGWTPAAENWVYE
ncbi:unnamed protein product [Leptidea sinapis]|uniref:Nucleoside diphosphate kinase n=1 Tax=Leptidea sinapis TaxID=189913 RepID=A0A5E4Q226_9NEOP|nr:unnamed protein product [Leptidea sinapis]